MHYVKTLFLTSVICLLSIMDASSQQPIRNYEAEWKKVTELVAKRLPQSALLEVKKIYAQAKKDNQDAQVIKALVFIDWNNGYNNDRFGTAISDREFSRVMQGMEKEWLEANKMKSANQIIATNYLTSAQVRQMMQLFSLENNKVDLAKQAYVKTVDQRNFLSTVSDMFSFSSSRDELARYIRNIR